jgi:hypothetical protein
MLPFNPRGKTSKKLAKRTARPRVFDIRKELRADQVQANRNVWSFKSKAINQQDTYTMEMIYDQPLSSDGSGNNNLTLGNSPASTSNWSNVSAVFDEYRVLAMKLQYRPNEFNGGSVVQAPITSVIDYDTSAALTGYTLAAQYSSQVEFRGSQNWTRTAYMSGVENSGFVSTGSPGNTFWIKLYTSGNTINTTLGRYVITFVVQFRGKGI